MTPLAWTALGVVVVSLGGMWWMFATAPIIPVEDDIDWENVPWT